MLIPRTLRDEIFVSTSIGECHKWGYDSYSLAKLLKDCGFSDIQKMRFDTSEIPNFNSYLLDINIDNTPYKGCSSLYMEAYKRI